MLSEDIDYHHYKHYDSDDIENNNDDDDIDYNENSNDSAYDDDSNNDGDDNDYIKKYNSQCLQRTKLHYSQTLPKFFHGRGMTGKLCGSKHRHWYSSAM